MNAANSFKTETILVSKKDLPIHCPPKDASNWSMHPKVFLSFDVDGQASCPYCGASYKLDQ